jgi:hypothetical protein
MPETDYRKLLGRTLIAMTLCVAAVLVCYFWIDRSVAFFVDHHQINKFRVFRWLTYPPPELQTWSPLVLTLLMVRRAWGPFVRWQKVLLVACLSLIVADEFRTSLGDVCGRYWPETWSNNDSSLIGNGRYGFHPFQRGDDNRQLSVRPRHQDFGLCNGVVDCDAPQPSYRHRPLCCDAREPCSDELSFCQRRDCRQRFGRDCCHIRGAFGPAGNTLREYPDPLRAVNPPRPTGAVFLHIFAFRSSVLRSHGHAQKAE